MLTASPSERPRAEDEGRLTIRLHHPRNAGDVAADHVYFAFASGRLGYDCHTCGSKCCRGFGYVSNAGELQRQVAMRPGLPLFVEPTGDKAGERYLMHNAAPGCFFLADSGRCDLHATNGFSAKPETCRLYPFNAFMRFGKYFVVGLHRGICPLAVMRVDAPSKDSQHEHLLRVMADRGIAAPVPAARVLDDADDVIARERRATQLAANWPESGGVLGYILAEATTAHPHTAPVVRERLHDLTRFATALFGIEEVQDSAAEPELTRTILVSSGCLRAAYLFRSEESTPPSGLEIRSELIPDAIWALFLVARAASRAGMRRISVQTLCQLQSELAPLLTLMAYCTRVVTWRARAPIELDRFEDKATRGAFLRVARALLPSVQQRRPRTLGDVLLEHAPSSPIERQLFLKRIARLAVDVFVPLDEEPSLPPLTSRGRLRSAVERWALAHMDDKVLMKAGSSRP